MKEDLDKLSAFLGESRPVNLLVGAHPEDDDEVCLQRLMLHDELAEDFRRIVRGAVPNPADVEPRPYDPGYKPDRHELTCLALDEAPAVRDVVDMVGQVGAAELFDANDDTIDSLHFYAVVVGGGRGRARRAIFFRSYDRKKELSRSGLVLALWSKGSYNRMREKAFLFDENVDCFAWNGTLYIRSIPRFQRIFHYLEEVQKRARENAKKIGAAIPIANLDEFADACSKIPAMAAKAASVASKPYLRDVNMDHVRRVIDQFGVKVDIVTDGGTQKLHFDAGPKQRWLILKVLDDDYLRSVMTELGYEVNSKLPVAT